MGIASFDPQQQTVMVTPAAVAHFKRQLSKSQNSAVRLSVKQSGCTGWMYVVDLVKEPKADDLQLTLEDGVQLWVDSKSLAVVGGTEIDYVTEGVNQQLRFNNPRVKDYCGCGESFSVN